VIYRHLLSSPAVFPRAGARQSIIWIN
jgi:hypothetical protein